MIKFFKDLGNLLSDLQKMAKIFRDEIPHINKAQITALNKLTQFEETIKGLRFQIEELQETVASLKRKPATRRPKKEQEQQAHDV